MHKMTKAMTSVKEEKIKIECIKKEDSLVSMSMAKLLDIKADNLEHVVPKRKKHYYLDTDLHLVMYADG